MKILIRKHFYIKNKKNVPVGCVAYTVRDTGEVTFGTAAHNPVDKFDRDRMVSIATARCRGGGCEVILTKPNELSGQVIRAIKARIVEKSYFPHRIRRPLQDQRSQWDHP